MKTCKTFSLYHNKEWQSLGSLFFPETSFLRSDSVKLQRKKKNPDMQKPRQLVFPPRRCQAVLQASVDIFNLYLFVKQGFGFAVSCL